MSGCQTEEDQQTLNTDVFPALSGPDYSVIKQFLHLNE